MKQETIRVRVAGFDENGLGPKLGPLVITGVLIRVAREDEMLLGGRRGPIDDSKKIFQRTPRSYARGEAAALAILRGAQVDTSNTRALGRGLGLPEGLPQELDLPVWCRREDVPELEDLDILAVKSLVLGVKSFNDAVRIHGNKFNLDAASMVKIAKELVPFDLGIFGKVGGRRFYQGFLLPTAGQIATVSETSESSRYLVSGAEWRFAKAADATYLPVAAASLVGKYLRELYMLELNRSAGFGGEIPYCSGYPGDPRTPALVRALSRRFGDSSEFLRVC